MIGGAPYTPWQVTVVNPAPQPVQAPPPLSAPVSQTWGGVQATQPTYQQPPQQVSQPSYAASQPAQQAYPQSSYGYQAPPSSFGFGQSAAPPSAPVQQHSGRIPQILSPQAVRSTNSLRLFYFCSALGVFRPTSVNRVVPIVLGGQLLSPFLRQAFVRGSSCGSTGACCICSAFDVCSDFVVGP